MSLADGRFIVALSAQSNDSSASETQTDVIRSASEYIVGSSPDLWLACYPELVIPASHREIRSGNTVQVHTAVDIPPVSHLHCCPVDCGSS